jgi:hypothetical protein
MPISELDVKRICDALATRSQDQADYLLDQQKENFEILFNSNRTHLEQTITVLTGEISKVTSQNDALLIQMTQMQKQCIASIAASGAAEARVCKLENQLQDMRTSSEAKLNSLDARLTTNFQQASKPIPFAKIAALPKPPIAKPSASVTAPIRTNIPAKSNKSSTPVNITIAKKSDAFTVVKPKKSQKSSPPVLLKPTFSVAEREIILSFSNPTLALTPELALKSLTAVNSVITASNDIPLPPFCRTRFTNSRQLILVTGPSNKGFDYDPFLKYITDALDKLEYGSITTRLGQKTSQFLLHNVPCYLNPDEVREQIESQFQTIKLAHSPRWLTKPEARIAKMASSMVLSILGEISLKSLGEYTIYIANQPCRIDQYMSITPLTQCGNCQRFGHPTIRCRANPACAVCAAQHSSKDHLCLRTDCNGGLTCTHFDIKCILCNGQHKATDPKCPEKVKIEIAEKARKEALTSPQPSDVMNTSG